MNGSDGRELQHSIRFGLAIVFLLGASALAAADPVPPPPAAAPPGTGSAEATLRPPGIEPVLVPIEEHLQRGEWKPALDAVEPVIVRVLNVGRDTSQLGRLVAFRALAEAGLGRPEEAVWDWQVAQNLTAVPIAAADLAALGEPGKLLAAHPLRKLGEAPAGLEVSRIEEASGAAPAGAPPAAAGGEVRTHRTAGSIPEMPRSLLGRSVPKWMTAELVVDAEGRPRDPVVLSSRLDAMTYTVLNAARGWTFAPATVGGKPVASFYRLAANGPSGRPFEQLIGLDASLQPIAALLHAGKWQEAEKRAKRQWDDALDGNEQSDVYLGALSALEAVAESGLGHETQAICRWGAAQTLDPEVFHASFAGFGPPGELLDRNRWGAYSVPVDRGPRGTGGVQRPVIVERIQPRFPRSLRHPDLKGSTILQAIIDPDGAVRELEILRTSGWHDFDAAALQAICDWKFAPATHDGRKVATYYTLTVNYLVGK